MVIPRLAAAHRDAATVEQVAREATEQGSVVGVQVATIEEELSTPWARLPSRKRNPLAIYEPLPKFVRAVLAQKLFVDKSGLPSPLINRDQAPSRLPKSGILQEAENAPLDRDDAASDLLRGGPRSIHLAAPVLRRRGRAAAR